MSTKLKNRRATEQQLGTFIQNMTVSEHMVVEIMDSEVGAGVAGGARRVGCSSGRGRAWLVCSSCDHTVVVLSMCMWW